MGGDQDRMSWLWETFAFTLGLEDPPVTTLTTLGSSNCDYGDGDPFNGDGFHPGVIGAGVIGAN
jgi:hypothetical protein